MGQDRVVDAVFHCQESLKRLREKPRQFLPCEQLQAAAESATSYRAHYGIPILNEIGTPRVAQHAERSSGGMCSQYSADQLVTGYALTVLHPSTIENLVEVLIAFEKAKRRGLKVAFGQFRFHQQVA